MGERPWWAGQVRLLRTLRPPDPARFAIATAAGEMSVRPHIAAPQVHRQVLDPAQCQRVRELAHGRGFGFAHDSYGEAGRAQSRRCHAAYLGLDDDTEWLYDRVAEVFERANATYGFAVSGLVEPLMVACYREGDHFDWHLDVGPELSANRKLSLSILLNPGEAYRGGDLDFAGAVRQVQDRHEGTAVVFPAYLAHRVTRVEGGLRLALVAFAYGPSFA